MEHSKQGLKTTEHCTARIPSHQYHLRICFHTRGICFFTDQQLMQQYYYYGASSMAMRSSKFSSRGAGAELSSLAAATGAIGA